jgi:hypothetical protein
MTLGSRLVQNSAPSVSFSGHETFVFRYPWMKKAVDAVLEEPAIFASNSAMMRLGIGKNMVRSMRHWGLASRVLQEVPRTRGTQLAVGPLGQFLFGSDGRDPYLEDVNSLWLLHWNLATNEARCTTCCWIFNLFPSNEFTRDSLTVFAQLEAHKRQIKIASENSLRRDIDCFLRTYTASRGLKGAVAEDSLDCPLVELGFLLDDRAWGTFHFRRGVQPSLSDEVFTACLLEFWERAAPDRDSLAFNEVAYGFGSPGLVFKLNEDSLSDRLERVESVTQGRLCYAETAGLKQLYRRSAVNPFELLERHYEHSFSTMFVGV